MTYHFEQFEFDEADFRFSQNGKSIPLEPKALHLLLYLLENRNRLVRKQEILDGVWQESNVTENSLTRAMFLLRKALNDDSRIPRFIETVPTLGYRFIAPVTITGEAVPATTLPQQSSEPAVDTVVQALLDDARLATSRRAPPTTTFAFVALLTVAAVVGVALWIHTHVGPPIHSIAVLPLDNFSGDASQNYFADGVTEAITSELAQVSSLEVVSRTSAGKYRGSSASIPQIARELHVDAVVEGSIARQGDQVRVTAQLIRASDDRHLWASSYDRKLDNVLALESDVAKEIVTHVRAALTPGEKTRLTRTDAIDPATYDLYLQGRYYAQQLNKADNDRAISYFEQAVARDPNFAPLYGALAFEYGTRANELNHSDDTWNRKAFVADGRCIELDPNLAECYLARGTLLWTAAQHFPHASAVADFKHAIALNPSNDDAHEWLANVYNHTGLFDKAREQLLKTEALNPGNTAGRFRLAVNLNYQGRYQEALNGLSDSEHFAPHLWAFQVSFALMHLGRLDEAQTFLQKALQRDSGDTSSMLVAQEAVIAAAKGNHPLAEQKIAESIRLGTGFGHFHHTEYAIASAYALMNQKDQAIEWLQRAAEEGFPCYPIYAIDSNLANLRNEPRFTTFMANLHAQWQHNQDTL